MHMFIQNAFQRNCYLNQMATLGVQIKGQNDGHHIFFPLN